MSESDDLTSDDPRITSGAFTAFPMPNSALLRPLWHLVLAFCSLWVMWTFVTGSVGSDGVRGVFRIVSASIFATLAQVQLHTAVEEWSTRRRRQIGPDIERIDS